MESVPEIADLKMKVLAEIEELAGVQTVIGGTNSSSYSSSAFSHALKDPTRFLNIHFLWPPAMNAVEGMSCGHTSADVVYGTVGLLKDAGLNALRLPRGRHRRHL